MNKIIMLLLSLLYLPLAWSEPALYKEIKIEAIEHLLVDGNIEIELIQSDALKAEVYVRESSKSNLQIGTEKSEDGLTLVIREVLPSQFSSPEVVSTAKVKVYLPNIQAIHLENIATFTMQKFDIEKLKINASGSSILSFSDSKIVNWNISLQGQASFTGNNLTITNGIFRQHKNTTINLQHSFIHNLDILNKGKSKFYSEEVNGDYLKAYTNGAAQLTFSGKSEFVSAKLTTQQRSKIDTHDVTFKSISLITKNNAKTLLGKAELLDINARHSTNVKHFPTAHTQIKKLNRAEVKQHENSLGIHNE